MKKDEKMTSNRNFFDAFMNSLNGIWYTIKTQRNIRIQLIVAIFVIIAGAIFKFSIIEFIFLLFASFLVIVTEMINTAIEANVDLTTTEFHPTAKIAKDVSAGAVLVSSINAIIVGCILFLGKIF